MSVLGRTGGVCLIRRCVFRIHATAINAVLPGYVGEGLIESLDQRRDPYNMPGIKWLPDQKARVQCGGYVREGCEDYQWKLFGESDAWERVGAVYDT